MYLLESLIRNLYKYKAYGLNIHAVLELPELISSDSDTADVVIRVDKLESSPFKDSSEYYMTDLSALIRQAIIYDELMQINNRNPAENLQTRQEVNRKLLIDKEVELVKAAVQQDILPEKPLYYPMFNMHSLIMTSLVQLLMDVREHNLWVEKAFQEKITAWKKEAQSICAETDDVLSNLKTMHALKLMSTLISIEEQCAEDDGENH